MIKQRLMSDMEETLFDDLLQSLKETKAITEGTAKATREFKVDKTPIRPDTNSKGRSQFFSRRTI